MCLSAKQTVVNVNRKMYSNDDFKVQISSLSCLSNFFLLIFLAPLSDPYTLCSQWSLLWPALRTPAHPTPAAPTPPAAPIAGDPPAPASPATLAPRPTVGPSVCSAQTAAWARPACARSAWIPARARVARMRSARWSTTTPSAPVPPASPATPSSTVSESPRYGG